MWLILPVAFKDEFGHTNVQQHYKGTPGLGNWVLGMRRKHREKALPQERIDILNAMGFQWRLRAVKIPGGRNIKAPSTAAAPPVLPPPPPPPPSPQIHHHNEHHHHDEPLPYNHHHDEAPWNRF
jgi:Helicase associated domain